MAAVYRIPAGQHRSDMVVVNSQFITTIGLAPTPEVARAFIASIRAEMPDANHHVYAFRTGYGNSVIEGMSDDGEPAGTAGPPTLAVLRGVEIGDIILVTTRYFGGTKLGTGGLVRAYTDAARTSLDSLPTELKAPKTRLGMDIPYPDYTPVKRLIDAHHGSIDEETFSDTITLFVTFLSAEVDAFSTELMNLTAGRVQPLILD
jgi:uncharacterized YigZ family protein